MQNLDDPGRGGRGGRVEDLPHRRDQRRVLERVQLDPPRVERSCGLRHRLRIGGERDEAALKREVAGPRRQVEQGSDPEGARRTRNGPPHTGDGCASRLEDFQLDRIDDSADLDLETRDLDDHAHQRSPIIAAIRLYWISFVPE
ncbi:hypothetical protein C5C18_09745 [Rathayibacter tritici]|nr:hypothetical protein C5C21_10025 [Rathayibacter tritici]PPG06655.1 hypothetical protein C5C18_09745 [Rathayibacter tritici]